MDNESGTRRRFLIRSLSGLSSAWLTLHWPAVLAAQDHAHRAAESPVPVPLQFFSAEQAAEIEAVIAQIIPTDETPGAREAQVVHFIDRALITFDRDKQPSYTQGAKRSSGKNKGPLSSVKEIFGASHPRSKCSYCRRSRRRIFSNCAVAHHHGISRLARIWR